MTPETEAGGGAAASGSWILLRGLGREARHWGPLPVMLEASGLGEVLSPDHPGCGTESGRSAPLSMAEMVDDLRARGFRGRASILGLSLGGMVGMEWASRYPDEVERLVIVNASAGDLSPTFQRLRPAAVRILLGAGATRDVKSRERAGFRLTLNSRNVVTPELIEEWARIQESAPISRVTFLRQLAASVRFRVPKQLDCPILILSLSRDRMVDPRCSFALAAHFPAAKLESHPTAGHDLPLEDPAWVAERISRWVSS